MDDLEITDTIESRFELENGMEVIKEGSCWLIELDDSNFLIIENSELGVEFQEVSRPDLDLEITKEFFDRLKKIALEMEA